MLFLFFVFISPLVNELDDFMNKDIKIFFSGYTSTILGTLEGNPNISAISKYLDFNIHKFNPKVRMIRNKGKYEIYFSGKSICKTGKVVSTCNKIELWDINQKPFGYTISQDNMCITKDEGEAISLKKCVDTDDQIFQFKKMNTDCDVKEDKDRDMHQVNLNIIAHTTRPLKITPPRHKQKEAFIDEDRILMQR